MVKDVTRRDFLKLLLIGYIKPNKLRYPLESVPDDDTKLDPIKAAKARKLAEYVITKNMHPGLKWYNEYSGTYTRILQKVEADIFLDDFNYYIVVFNFNELRNQTPDASVRSYDTISIDIISNKKNGQVVLQDSGLDGRCDYGFIQKDGPFNETGKELIFSHKKGKGTEHADMFQKLYETTLDKLIQFYEKPTK